MLLNGSVLILPLLPVLFSLLVPATASVEQDLDIIRQRRIDIILGGLQSFKDVQTWTSTLTREGTWPDVDYTTGCEARRANWKATDHWFRIVAMAGAWHGGVNIPTEHYKNEALRNAISRAMNHWLDRDFTNNACIDRGGEADCPCSNLDKTYWNTNWFSNVVYTPKNTAKAALLLGESLSSEERAKLIAITTRSYATLATPIVRLGPFTGANALEVAQLGIDQALLTGDAALLTEAYGHARREVPIKNGIMVDGVRPDGSFGQHGGLLYNGNYGNDFSNAVLTIEIAAAGTSFAATDEVRSAIDLFVEANAWMIYENVDTDVKHFDYNVIGRMISSPVADMGAAGSIRTNITQVGVLGDLWSSKALQDFAARLSKPASSANAGDLVGNRMFFSNDYMVQRGENYVSTFKMFSSRSMNTECMNGQNLLGVNLGSGTLYTYIQGDEYEDIHAAMDPDLIPGFTVAYKSLPAPDCANIAKAGLEPFVGGASTGQVGIAVMRYKNAHTKAISYQKANAFLPGGVHVTMVNNLRRDGTAPIYSVLDQKKRKDKVYVDDVEVVYPTSNTSFTPSLLWHSNVGYTFEGLGDKLGLSVKTGVQHGDWSKVGISTQPATDVDLFAAWIEHKDLNAPLTYVTYPGVTREQFSAKRQKTSLQIVQNDASISAIYDATNQVAMFSFWDAAGGKASFTPTGKGASPISVTTDGNAAVILNLGTGELAVSDPSQTRETLALTVVVGSETQKVPITLPQGGLLGKSVVIESFRSKEAIEKGNKGASEGDRPKSAGSHSSRVQVFEFAAAQVGFGSVAMLLSYL